MNPRRPISQGMGPFGDGCNAPAAAPPVAPRRCVSLGLAVVALAAALARPALATAEINLRAGLHPQRAALGDTVTLTLEVTGAQDLPPPAVAGVAGLEIRYRGPSTQISIVNGRTSMTVQHRYAVTPSAAGRYQIGPFSVEYQGQRYNAAALGLEVVATGDAPATGGPRSGKDPSGPAAAPEPAALSRSLRLTLSAPQAPVYLHQRIPIDVTLYVGSVRVADLQYPTVAAEGMSVDKFLEPARRQEVIDAETFQVLQFRTTIMPLRAGMLTLGPATLRLNVLQRRRSGFNDPLFERFFGDDPFTTERRPLDVRSEPVALTVLPLPEEGRPPGFSGAVGVFTLQVTASPREVAAGDPVSVRMALGGTGNLGDAEAPVLTAADGLRTYAPQAARSDADGGAGAVKVFEQVIIPTDTSVRAVPPVRFSYFDPTTARYHMLESEPIALVVRPPQGALDAEVVAAGAAAGHRRNDDLGRDIVYIKDDPGHLRSSAQPAFVGRALFLWPPLPLLMFAAAVWYERRRQRLTGDVRYARFRQAGKTARRALAASRRQLAAGNRAAFYDALSRAMQEYLGAKLDLPPGAIDATSAMERGLAPEDVAHLRQFFAACEHVRFAPSGGDGDMRGTLQLAETIVSRLERTGRRLVRRTMRLSLWLCTALLTAVSSAGAAEPPPASPQTTFFHANALYRDGQYRAAARQYEEVLRAGWRSGNLHFNLGNAYFKAEEEGRAVLNYERARRLMPGDPDVRSNLAYVQSLTGAEPCAPPLWQRLAFPLAGRLPTPTLVWLVCVTYTLMLGLLTAHRLWSSRPRGLLHAAMGLAALLLVSGASLGRQVAAEEWWRQGVNVHDGEVPVRFEPSDSGTVHFTLPEGTLVRVTGERRNWLQVARCDGRRGWAEQTAIEDLD